MSYSHTYIIPKDPDFVPSDDQAKRGKEFIEKKAGGDYLVTIIDKCLTPRLYSAEENWCSFTCPRCKKLVRQMHYEDVSEEALLAWWHSLDEHYRSYSAHPEDLLINWWYMELYGLRSPDQILTVPCCGSQVIGKEFDFGADAAFSKFALIIEDSDILEDGYFCKEDIQALESALGFEMRIIIAQGT